jgi:LEA14-like dessication related protein
MTANADGDRRRTLLAVCAATTALAACGLLPPIGLKSPRLSFAGLSVTGLGLSEIRFRVALLASNPNDVELPLSNLRFDLDLLGEPFASGAPPTGRATIPAAGQAEIPVEFTVPTSKLVDALRRLRLDQDASIDYRVRGSANWGNSPITLHFERRDRIDPLKRLRNLLEPQRKT